MKLTEEQIKAATQARIHRAMRNVQRAQVELGEVCGALGTLEHVERVHTEARTLYDAIHAFWYKVEMLTGSAKVRLDRDSIEAIERASNEGDKTS